MIGKLVQVAPTGPCRLDVAWDDGVSGSVDLSEVIARYPALAELSDPDVFGAVGVSDDGWSLEWPSGVDFGAAQLRRWFDEGRGEIMSPQAFRSWMEMQSLTQEAAAGALGLSRRMVAYYLSGEKPIPKTVLLATEGYAARHAA